MATETLEILPYKKNDDGNYIIIPPKRNYSGITAVNKEKNPDGYIYFIKAKGHNFYKLGVSSNPQKRICDIDSYLPFDLEILSIHFIKDVYNIEENISRNIKQHKIRREWYELSVDQAKAIMIELYIISTT